MAQWHEAAPRRVSNFISRMSNVSTSQAARAGQFSGVGPFGTYDMAGNVREWVFNATDDGARFILGGAWPSPAYL